MDNSLTDYESFYDIETQHQDINTYNQNNLQTSIQHHDINRPNNNQYICNKIMLNRLIFLFFIFSISFIIYDYHEKIGFYFNKIVTIF